MGTKILSEELLLSIPGAFMGFPHAFFGPTPMAPRIPLGSPFGEVDGMSRHLGDDKTNRVISGTNSKPPVFF